ncbi:MAG: glutamate--tRNA ligase [Gammaproteobacteria bacterium]|nr:glutamate--tRNA ligase [Gammaproteobacteria bacterium]
MTVRTRFAPSPTGFLHIGGARTALFSWLHAHHAGGQFILRIEDTDRERSTQESVDAILDGMAWLSLDYDEGPFYQTHRFDRYKEIIQQLLHKNQAYFCFCSKERLEKLRNDQMKRGEKPRYDRNCRESGGFSLHIGPPPVVRFKNPIDDVVQFDDLVRGRISIQNNELDDLIIARSDGTPTYNFTVVVDDIDMQITHVIRGDDHINNTPRQINMFEALDAPLPVFGHVPMILGSDGQRLSKRHGAVSVLAYQEQGVLPEALCNYLIRLGWSHGDQEIFSRDEMIELFDMKNVNKAPAAFNQEKLLWLNQHYIKEADGTLLVELLKAELARREIDTDAGPGISLVVEALRERAQSIVEMADKCEYMFRDFAEYDEKAANKNLRPVAGPLLEAFRAKLEDLDEWSTEPIHAAIESVGKEQEVKLGKIAQPVRVAVTGSSASPPIDVTLELVGKERTLERLKQAISYIEQRKNNA